MRNFGFISIQKTTAARLGASRNCRAGWHPARRLAIGAPWPGCSTTRRPIDNRPQAASLPHIVPAIRLRMLNSNIVQLSRRRFAATLSGSLGAARLAAVPSRPKLCVLLAAEQFRSDYLSQFAGLFGPGGFRRLMEQGAFLPDCRMASSSFSATGLATIATGAYPEAHGIVAESWYDAASKKIIAANASLTLADTLADQVAGAGGRVFAAGMHRDHAELLVRGAPSSRTRHTVLALEGPPGEEPAWVEAFRQSHSPDRYKNAKWNALQAAANAPPLRVLVDDPERPQEFMALYG